MRGWAVEQECLGPEFWQLQKNEKETTTEALSLQRAFEIVSLFESKGRRDSCGLGLSKKEEMDFRGK